MKKIAIFLFIIIIIVATVAYVYLNYTISYNKTQKENAKFEVNKDEEIYGSDLATLINKSIDFNEKNDIKKDENNKYINNKQDSINIDIKFIDDKVTYNMEKIYNSGINEFLSYYKDIKFKCNDVQYHNKTKRIKYMLFEQITQ